MSMPASDVFTPNCSPSRARSATSPACSRALVGMQPRCRQVPPTLSRSTSTTLMPSSAARSAAAYPPEPPPRITRSAGAAGGPPPPPPPPPLPPPPGAGGGGGPPPSPPAPVAPRPGGRGGGVAHTLPLRERRGPQHRGDHRASRPTRQPASARSPSIVASSVRTGTPVPPLTV